MNPFEAGMIMGNCFNSVMSRNIAKKGSRIVQGKEYKYLYNPMWSFFGDLSKTPLGTHYYNSSTHINYHWNIFDQVLIRPELIDCVKYDELKILVNDGNLNLLNKNGIPDKKVSDHLPLLFTIDLGEIV